MAPPVLVAQLVADQEVADTPMLLEPARLGKVLRADSVMVRGTPMGAGAAVAVQEALAGRVLLAQAPGVSAGPGFTAALPET